MDDDVYINSCNSAIALAKLPPVEDKIYAFIKFKGKEARTKFILVCGLGGIFMNCVVLINES